MSKDFQAKSRSRGYFNDLLVNDPAKLLKLYSIGIADDIEDNRGVNVKNSNTNGRVQVWNKQSGGKRIAYVNLAKTHRRKAVVGMTAASYAGGADDTVGVSGQFDENPAWVPVYFLPWIKDGGGGVVHLHIPDIATHATVANSEGNNIPNPSIFMTASITGCSIFFQGTSNSPRVFHAGGATGHVNNPVMAAQHWQDVMNDEMDPTKGARTGEVSKLHYIDAGVVGGPTGSTTTRANQYDTWLRNKYTNRLTVSSVQPWGSVIGFRDPVAGTWRFFLQENATIYYFEYKKNFLGMKTNTVSLGMNYVSRPLMVSEVFPGVGHAWIPNQQPKLKFA